MNELLGFVVLTGPLLFIVIWALVCIALAVWVSRRLIKKGISVKIAGGLLVFFISLILPVTDEIAGRIYLNHLCENEAGAKVYKTVELPAEYWDWSGQGGAVLRKNNIGIHYALLDGKYSKKTESKYNVPMLKIEEHQRIFKTDTEDAIATVINYRFWGGWMLRSTTSSNPAIDCNELHGNQFWNEFYKSIFIPRSSDSQE